MTTKRTGTGRWLAPRQVAEYLGETETRVREWFSDGTLPAWREGGRWRTKREWVEEFATQREQQALARQRMVQQRRAFGRRTG